MDTVHHGEKNEENKGDDPSFPSSHAFSRLLFGRFCFSRVEQQKKRTCGKAVRSRIGTYLGFQVRNILVYEKDRAIEIAFIKYLRNESEIPVVAHSIQDSNNIDQ